MQDSYPTSPIQNYKTAMYRRRKDKAWFRRSKEIVRIWKSNLNSVDEHFNILCTEIEELKIAWEEEAITAGSKIEVVKH